MFTYKNNAFSSIEIIISLTVFLVVSSIFFSVISPTIKMFRHIQNEYKREKEIISFRELIHSHFTWSESKNIRIIQVDNDIKTPSFDIIFSNDSEKNGNLFIIKYNFLEKSKNEAKKSIKYRYFSLYKDELGIGYVEEKDVYTTAGALKYTSVGKDYEGYFKLENEKLKIFIKDKKRNKIYEEILYYKEKE